MTHWLLHVLGVDNVSGPAYAFWSGSGADIGELAIAGGLVTVYRKHNCHVKGCPRIGRHPVAGTTYVVCGHHHPAGAPTAADVTRAHRAYQEGPQRG